MPATELREMLPTSMNARVPPQFVGDDSLFSNRGGCKSGIPWDDYMDHAIQDSLDFTTPFPINIGGGKACFSTNFHIWVGDSICASWYVNSIVSVNNHLVVIAYPSDIANRSDCNP